MSALLCVYAVCFFVIIFKMLNVVWSQIAFFEEGQNVESLSHQWGFEMSDIEQLGPQWVNS